jgi:hypothetical protein
MSERPATGDWPAPAGSVPPHVPTVPGYEVLQELGRGEWPPCRLARGRG